MLVSSKKTYSYGGKAIKKGVNRDPHRLYPAFADKLERVFETMRNHGYDPILWEGYRTAERAQELADRGSGKVNSMHRLGLAADVVENGTLWNASPLFWKALGEAAKEHGLHWGGDWDKVDKPHIQYLPPSEDRALFAMTPAQLDEHLRHV